MLILFIPCSGALALLWTVGMAKLVRTNRLVPSLRRGVPEADREPTAERICAVVPAHNEETAIEGAIRALAAQRGVDLVVVLALDRCTDETRARAERAIAGNPRFRVVEIATCPDGWPGKVHAIWQAIESSEEARSADLLLFVDADATMDPDCVRAAAALRRLRGLEIVSLLPTLGSRRWFEKIVQPLCALELSYEFPLLRANGHGGGRGFVNGQFVLSTREAYERLGGHAELRHEMMEDFALARRAAEARVPIGVFPADGLFKVDMYDTWDGFVEGWARIFGAGAGRKVSRMTRWTVRIVVACTVLPLCAVAAVAIAGAAEAAQPWARVVSGAMGVVALGVWAVFMGAIYRRQRAPLWALLLNPAASFVVAAIMWRAARAIAMRRPVQWGGRAYILEPR